MAESEARRAGWPTSLADYIGYQNLGVRDGVHCSSMLVRPEHLALFRCTQLVLHPK